MIFLLICSLLIFLAERVCVCVVQRGFGFLVDLSFHTYVDPHVYPFVTHPRSVPALSPSVMDRLAKVEIQLVMQLLDRHSLLQFARCSLRLQDAVNSRWVWKYQLPFYIKLWQSPWQQWIRPPSNKRWWKFSMSNRKSVWLGGGPATLHHPHIVIQGAATELGKLPDCILAAAHTVSIRIKKGYAASTTAKAAEALTKCTSIRVFGCKQLKNIVDDRFLCLLDALYERLATVQKLNSTITQLTACSSFSHVHINRLFEHCSQLLCLRVFAFSHFKEDGPDLCRGIAATVSQITFLDLRGLRFNPVGLEILAAAIAASTTLSTVLLCIVSSSNRGTAILVPAIQKCKTLQTVDLSNNAIDDNDDVVALAELIRSTCTLTELHLDGNRIEDRGIKDIADALSVNQSLVSLHLRNTGMQMEGSATLARVLVSKNTTLQRIAISTNDRAHAAQNVILLANFKKIISNRKNIHVW